MDAHTNFAYSTVATAPSPASSGLSLVVASGDGALFPAVPFNATVWPAGAQPLASNAEIVRVTAISTDTFTITRAQEGSSARSIVVGDQIAATITAKTLTDVEAAAGTLALIEEKVASGGATASFDFTSIPSSYRSLLIYGMIRGSNSAAGTELHVKFNNDGTAAHYDDENKGGRGTGAIDFSWGHAGSNGYGIMAIGASGSVFEAKALHFEATIPYYADTTYWKQMITKLGSLTHVPDYAVQVSAIQWHDTSAINRITFLYSAGNIVDGSKIAIYGLT